MPPVPTVQGQTKRFVVLHDNVHGLTALRHLCHASGIDQTQIWLYGDMPRWKREHATNLWQLGCGKSHGDPVDCVSHQSRIEAEVERPLIVRHRKKHHHHGANKQRHVQARTDPLAVGFGVDLNVWQSDPKIPAFFKRNRALLVALIPASVVHVALREAHHGAVSPLMQGVPGRLVGVARSQFAKDLSATQPQKRHLQLICPKDSDPENMLRVLKKHLESHNTLRQQVKQMERRGMRVLVLDPQQFLNDPNDTYFSLHRFLLSTETLELNDVDWHHNHQRAPIREAVGVPWYVLDECSSTLEATKIRLAVARDPQLAPLIDDIEQIQATIRAARKRRAKQHGPPRL